MKSKNRRKHSKRTGKLIFLILFFVVIIGIWIYTRKTSDIPLPTCEELYTIKYSENDSVMKAISLGYLIYGCEACDEVPSVKVNQILAQKKMGIIQENFGVNRLNSEDPSTALFDTAEFIRRYVGDFRYLTELKDEDSGFYGAAFCDDINKCIWIVYSGSETMTDNIACAGFVLMPGLSTQEKHAFNLMSLVLQSDEVKNQSYTIVLTGHSLGGSFATEVSLVSGYPAITINGADGLAIDKINAILGVKKTGRNINNYMTLPQKNKNTFRDLVQRLMYLGSYKSVSYHLYPDNGLTSDTHCAFSFIQFSDDKYLEPILPKKQGEIQ